MDGGVGRHNGRDALARFQSRRPGVRVPRSVRDLLLHQLEVAGSAVAHSLAPRLQTRETVAAGALAFILTVTVAWWALALWPVSSDVRPAKKASKDPKEPKPTAPIAARH